MFAAVLAILKWDPTIRGILFPSIMFMILVGSTYVILATNIGNRLGFLLANAAFWGWISLMCIVWMMYGIGMKGKDPSWVGQEAITDVSTAQLEKVSLLPPKAGAKVKGWHEVKEGTTTYGDATAALASYTKKKIADGGAALFPAKGTERFKPIAVYETGGDQRFKFRPRKIKGTDWYNPKNYRMMGLLHSKHYIVEVIRTYAVNDKGEPMKTADDKEFIIDKAAKPIYIVGYRDAGSRRRPPFVIFIFSTILLIISLATLHKRDQQVMTAMGALKPARA
jgi:hypothetical protein